MRIRKARPRIATKVLIGQPSVERSCHRYELTGFSVCLDQFLQVPGRGAVHAGEDVGDGVGDVEEPDPALEERLDGDLVGGVERARVRAAALAGLARQREERERVEVRRV